MLLLTSHANLSGMCCVGGMSMLQKNIGLVISQANCLSMHIAGWQGDAATHPTSTCTTQFGDSLPVRNLPLPSVA